MTYIDHMCAMFRWQLALINSPDDFWDACVMANELRSNE
jgi:hypothetical protein